MNDHIDVVARAMTDAEPRPDFRARVLASLPERRRPGWARILVPAAVAVAIGAIAWRVGTITHRTTDPVRVARAGAPVEPAVAEASAGTVANSGITVVIGTGGAGRRKPAVTAEDLAWQARAVPRLVPANALSIEPIQPAALSIAPITMEPVARPDPIALGAIEARAGGR